jgi:hypothetical protein
MARGAEGESKHFAEVASSEGEGLTEGECRRCGERYSPLNVIRGEVVICHVCYLHRNPGHNLDYLSARAYTPPH